MHRKDESPRRPLLMKIRGAYMRPPSDEMLARLAEHRLEQSRRLGRKPERWEDVKRELGL